MVEFSHMAVHDETKQRVADLRYEMQVNSMDAVVRELLRVYNRTYGERVYGSDPDVTTDVNRSQANGE